MTTSPLRQHKHTQIIVMHVEINSDICRVSEVINVVLYFVHNQSNGVSVESKAVVQFYIVVNVDRVGTIAENSLSLSSNRSLMPQTIQLPLRHCLWHKQVLPIDVRALILASLQFAGFLVS